jgi:hypothetical protein
MNLEQLESLYTAASDSVFNEYEESNFHEVTQKQLKQEMRRAGIRAVVEAIRDDLFPLQRENYVEDSQDIIDWFNEILGDAGERAAGSATAQIGEENDRCISERVQTAERGRSGAIGQSERHSGVAAHSADASPSGPRSGFSENEAGGSRHVGGQRHHGVSRDEAVGVVVGSEKAPAHPPAAAPVCPDCHGKKYKPVFGGSQTYYVHCFCKSEAAR